jgi:hypothetical protein
MAQLKAASSSLMQLAYIPETVEGETPTTGKGIDLRNTGLSLGQEISKETSKEINATRQTAAMYLTDAQVQGGINFELSSGEYDPFIEALLMGTWSNFGMKGKLAAGTAAFAKATKTITLTNAATGLGVGSYFSVSGAGIKDENRGPFRVKTIDTDKKVITVDAVIEDQSVINASVYHSRLTNGTTPRSFSLEKRFTDINQTFVYRGMQVNKGSFAFDMRAALTGSFDFMGRTSVVGTGRMLGDKTEYTASQTGKIIDSVLGMKDVLLDGVPIGDSISAGITKLSLDYDNSMQSLGAIGVLGSVGTIAGTIACSGTMEIYLNNAQVYNQVLTQKRFRLEWLAKDADGHGYAFILPSVELSSPKADVSQKDEAVILSLEFTALMDPSLQKTIIIERF